MSTIRIQIAVLGVMATVATGCPKPKPTVARVPDETLARDAQRLGPRLKDAKIPAAAQLLEAYLAHFRGKPDQRDQALCAWLRLTSLTPTSGTARLSAVRPPSRRRMRAFLAVLLQPRTCREPEPRASEDAPLKSGIYSFAETKTSLSGDTLAVQERWILHRKGDRVWGWYIRRLDRQSGDGRVYRCSRTTRYGVLMAFTFVGRPRSSGFTLEETDAYVQPGPCAPRQLRLDRCHLRPRTDGMLLRCPTERRLKRLSGLPAQGASGGVYGWAGPVTPRADGSRQRVTEQWHLLELAGKLHGFYTRAKRITARAGSKHKCNGKPTLVRRRLYLVGGTRRGDGVTLHELTALHRPGPCADSKVRLDTYRGSLAGGSLNLSWGRGNQTLKRDPSRQSQAFPLRWMPKATTPRK